MKEIKAIFQPFMLKHVLNALHRLPNLPAPTVSEVRAIDINSGSFDQAVKTKLEIMVPDEQADAVMRAIQSSARTGKAGDGRVFVIPIEETLSIRTGQPEWVPLAAEEVANSQNDGPSQLP